MAMSAPRAIRVGLIGPLPPPPGGIANQTRQLARLLAQEGVEVETVRANAPYRPRWIEPLKGVRAAFRLGPYLPALWRCAGRVDLFHVMASSGWAWHLFAAPAIRIARLRGVPVVVNYRGGGAEAFLAGSAASVRRTLAGTAAVLVPSGFLADAFRRFGIDAEIVPNVVDLARFQPDRRREPGHRVIVTRNLEEIYDIPTALRAFAKVREELGDADLRVAGAGSKLADLERLKDELGLVDAVEFTGAIDNERIAELYRTADLLLNPSTVDNTPISVLEALAAEVPVVSTNVGGVPYLVEDGRHAMLVPPRNPQAMAEAALKVLRAAPLRARLRSEGRAHVQQFTWAEVWPALSRVYSRASGVGPLAASAR
jgi:glycosyltransferase involved in cell wall biosynthesis